MKNQSHSIERRKQLSRLLQRIRVPAGFLYGALFLYLAQPTRLSLAVGACIAAIGLALRTWAAGHIRKHRQLAQSGPYRWSRNPLYLGSFVAGIGFCVAAAALAPLVLFAGLFPLIYIPVMRREEEELAGAYGAEFDEYRRAVSLFVPGNLRPKSGPSSGFSWGLVLENREYRAIIGSILLLAILVAKLLLS